MKIIYQQADGHWSDARQDIGGLSQTSGFLTHAAFSTERGRLKLVYIIHMLTHVSQMMQRCSWFIHLLDS